MVAVPIFPFLCFQPHLAVQKQLHRYFLIPNVVSWGVHATGENLRDGITLDFPLALLGCACPADVL